MKTFWLGACAAIAFPLAGAAQTPAPSAAGPSHYGAWGVDLTGEDHGVRPGDDFFAFADGAAVARLKISPDQSRSGPIVSLRDLSEARVLSIVTDAAHGDLPVQPATNLEKIGAAYKAFMDEGAIEALGAKPLEPDLTRLRAIENRSQLANLMGRSAGGLEASVFAIGINPDDKDPNRYVISIEQDGLGLPDRDYYLTPQFTAKKAAYQAYVAQLLTMINWPDAKAEAQAIVAFETKIAEASWSRAQLRDSEAVYNPTTLAALQSDAPGFDWDAFMHGAQLPGETHVIVNAKSAFPKISAIYAATPLTTLKAWEAFQMTDGASAYLSKAFTDARFEFRGRTLNGQEAERPRWKRGVASVNGSLGEAVGQIFVDRYFPPASKLKMQELTSNLKGALGRRIQALDWMGPATKAEAMKKLATFDIQIGYPKKWRDYSALVIRSDDLFGDIERAQAFEWAYNRARLHNAVDKDEWVMTPQTVNAYNMPDFNEVVFPAAILQPPFFDPKADPAVNYGAIGAVIGHEMTHGFDDQGRKYDAGGRLRDWWSAEDGQKFQLRARRLGAAYEAIPILPGAHINGQLTMGENIADLGGVLTALDAYHASLGGAPAPVIGGLTGDQRFFLGFAQLWRGKTRDDALRQQMVSDPHSPEKARVDGVVANIDAWYRAFDVRPGEKMYVAPDQRVRIW